jgi:hypothetical protein
MRLTCEATDRWSTAFPWGHSRGCAQDRPWVSRESLLTFAVAFAGAYTHLRVTPTIYAYQSLRLSQGGEIVAYHSAWQSKLSLGLKASWVKAYDGLLKEKILLIDMNMYET